MKTTEELRQMARKALGAVGICISNLDSDLIEFDTLSHEDLYHQMEEVRRQCDEMNKCLTRLYGRVSE